MGVPFGPQLIGQAEKALQALLLRLLDGTELTEPHWVTLRLALQADGTVDQDGLVHLVRDRARYADPDRLVAELIARGLLHDGAVTGQGRSLVAEVQARITETTAPLWRDLPAADVEAATRVLTEVTARARAALG